MSEVTVRWDIRAAGREVGDVETVELTDFVEALIGQGRVTVVPAEATFEAEVEAAVAAPKAKKAADPEPEVDAEA